MRGGAPQVSFVEIGEAAEVYEFSVLVTSLDERRKHSASSIATAATERTSSTK